MDFEKPEARKAPVILGRNETRVVVKLMFKTETRQAWLLVSVESQNKLNLWNHKRVNADQDPQKIRRDVAETAEQLAAYQIICYKDRHNPQAVARAALEALEEVFETAGKAKDGSKTGESSTG